MCLHMSLFVIEPGGRPHPNFLQQTDQFCSFTGPQYGHGFLHVHRMLLERSLDQTATRLGEFHDPAASVLRVGCPPEQLP